MMGIERGRESSRGKGRGKGSRRAGRGGAARTKRRNKFCAGEAIKVNASTKFQISQRVATKKNNIQSSTTEEYAVKHRI